MEAQHSQDNFANIRSLADIGSQQIEAGGVLLTFDIQNFPRG